MTVELSKKQKIFEWFYNLIKGRKDVKSRVAVIANPENPQSMSILTKSQAEFVQNSFWLAEEWPDIYGPMKDYAIQLLKTAPSIGGKRVEQVIGFMGAIGGAEVLKKLRTLEMKGEKEK